MMSSENRPERKHQQHRNHSDRSVVRYLVLVLCVAIVLAGVVGLILLLNSRVFVEPR